MKLYGAVGGVFFSFMVASLAAAGCSSSSTPATGSGGGSSGGGSSGGVVTTIPGCNPDSTVDCSASGADGWSCPSGTDPTSVDTSVSCSSPTPDGAGNDLYCCFSWTAGDSTCTPDDSITAVCPDPTSYGYRCDAPGDDPTSLDPALNCSAGVPDANGTSTDFCCTYDGTASGSSSGGTAGCASDATLACDAGSSGVDCVGGAAPDSTFGICSSPSPQSDGSDGYCCVDQTFSDCVQDDSVTAGCDYPSFGFSCSAGSPDPSTDDPSLTCSTPTTDPSTGNDLYCCQ